MGKRFLHPQLADEVDGFGVLRSLPLQKTDYTNSIIIRDL